VQLGSKAILGEKLVEILAVPLAKLDNNISLSKAKAQQQKTKSKPNIFK